MIGRHMVRCRCRERLLDANIPGSCSLIVSSPAEKEVEKDLDLNEKIIRPKGKTFKGNSCIFGVEPSAQSTQLIKSHLLKTSALNRTEILFDGY